MKITEQFYKEVFNESQLLQEIYVKDDFLDVIDDVANKTKTNTNTIDRAAIIDAIERIANNFTEGERDKKGAQKRWFDYDDPNTPPYYVKNVNYNNKKELEQLWSKNKEAFIKWIKQPTAIQEMQKLINNHKGESFKIDASTKTIQGEINAKFIRDCFMVFLNHLANNTHGTYKFFKKPDDISPLK